jgi:periodic tryptophan protein 2
MSAKLYTVQTVPGYNVVTLGGHRDTVINGFYAENNRIYTVTQDGTLNYWDLETTHPERRIFPATYKMTLKHFFKQGKARLVSASFQTKLNLLVIGFSNGTFGLWELPEFSHIHTLSIGQQAISTTAINPSGDWLAFGVAALGQLLVWEWQSESYVIKQQGHAYDLTSLAYSAQNMIATGGDDAKVKLWNEAGLCYVTFDTHTAPISGLQFAKNGRVLFSSSLDGTVRAWDMTRYRNFKTYTSPDPLQFGTMAVDDSCDLVCAGSVDSFEVFVWAVQTGKLVETLSGHKGPVSSMAFAGTQLITGSWDRTVRVWNIFDRSMVIEAFQHQSEILSLAVRPDQQQIAVTTLDGLISIWHLADGKQVGVIDGRKHIKGGRKSSDLVTAEQAGAGKCFTSITYSADGEYVLAGGNSKYVCIYHVASGTLARRFQISHNLSLEGMKEELNSRRLTDGGNLDVIERSMDDIEGEKRGIRTRNALRLPGASKGDLSERTTCPEVHTSCVKFAPTGRGFAAASTEGLMVFSLDERILFDPFDLDMDITPTTILDTLEERQYLTALLMSIRLNEDELIQQCLESVPFTEIDLLMSQFPLRYLDRLLKFMATLLPQSRHLEYLLRWCCCAFRHHARYLHEELNQAAYLKLLQKTTNQWLTDLGKMCESLLFRFSFVLLVGWPC